MLDPLLSECLILVAILPSKNNYSVYFITEEWGLQGAMSQPSGDPVLAGCLCVQ